MPTVPQLPTPRLSMSLGKASQASLPYKTNTDLCIVLTILGILSVLSDITVLMQGNQPSEKISTHTVEEEEDEKSSILYVSNSSNWIYARKKFKNLTNPDC